MNRIVANADADMDGVILEHIGGVYATQGGPPNGHVPNRN